MSYDDRLEEDPRIRRSEQFEDWLHNNLSALKDEYFEEPDVKKDFREYCEEKYEEMLDGQPEYEPEEEI